MPSWDLVIINTSALDSSRTPLQLLLQEVSAGRPAAERASDRLGLMIVAPAYLLKSIPFGSAMVGMPRLLASAIRVDNTRVLKKPLP